MTRIVGVYGKRQSTNEVLPEGFQLDAETNTEVNRLIALDLGQREAIAKQQELAAMLFIPAAEAACEVPIPFAIDVVVPAVPIAA